MAAPRDVAAGDFNDDGWPDIVVADSISEGAFADFGRIWILLNNRDGTFAPPTAIELNGVVPIRVSVGDLNGDGKQDLAVLVTEPFPGNNTLPIERRIVIMWNDGEGNFIVGPSHSIWKAPVFRVGGLAIRDIDGDLNLDVLSVVSHTSGSGVLAVLRGLGGGEFAPVVTYPAPQARAMALGSFDLGLEAWIASSPTMTAPAPFVTAFRHTGSSMFARVSTHYDTTVLARDAMFRDPALPGGPDRFFALADHLTVGVLLGGTIAPGTIRSWHAYGTGMSPYFGAWTILVPNHPPKLVSVNQAFSRNLSIHTQFNAPPIACYADCDSSSGVAVLDIFDFLCFSNAFAAKDPYACECDLTTGAGVCDILDFVCYLNAFARGCR